MNGVMGYLLTTTKINIYHCLGNPNPTGELCFWISIGY